VARDHSFHCIADTESFGRPPLLYACGVNGFNIQCPRTAIPEFDSVIPAILNTNFGKYKAAGNFVLALSRYGLNRSSSFHPGSADLSMTDAVSCR